MNRVEKEVRLSTYALLRQRVEEHARFTSALRRARRKQEMPRRVLAEKVGSSLKYLSEVERGRICSDELKARIAQVLRLERW